MRTSAATAAGRRRASAGASRSAPERSSRTRPRSPREPSRRGSTIRARPSLPAAWRLWFVAAAIVAGGLAIAYFAWFRHSSLVAVRDVKVEGVRSPDREQITGALTRAAQGMTTLDVDTSKLASAVSGFPAVAAVTADASFPHGLTVQVTERRPVLVARDGDREVAVAADGSFLPGVHTGGMSLPALQVDQLPDGGRLNGSALDDARVAGAAPGPLRALVESVATTDHGIVATLRGGIELRFGTAAKADAKWAAAAAVLSDPKVSSLHYIDLQVPSRPAIGG